MSNEQPKPTELIRVYVARDAEGAIMVHASATLPNLTPTTSGGAFAMAIVGANQAFDRYLQDLRNNEPDGVQLVAAAMRGYMACLHAPQNQKPMAVASAHSNKPLADAERAHVLRMRDESNEAMGTVPGLPQIVSPADPAKG